MLAKSRSRCWRRPRRLGKFDRPLHRAITSYLRMIEGRDEILGEHLGMVEHVLDRAHRRARHALAEELFPFVRGASGERGTHFRNQFSSILGSAAHRHAARIACQLRPADQLAQSRKEMIGVNRDIEPALSGGMIPVSPPDREGAAQ